MDHHIRDVKGTPPAFHANRPTHVKSKPKPQAEKHPPLELSEPRGTVEPPDEALPLGELDLPLRRAMNSAGRLRAFLDTLEEAHSERTVNSLMGLVATPDPETDWLVSRGLDKAIASSGVPPTPPGRARCRTKAAA